MESETRGPVFRSRIYYYCRVIDWTILRQELSKTRLNRTIGMNQGCLMSCAVLCCGERCFHRKMSSQEWMTSPPPHASRVPLRRWDLWLGLLHCAKSVDVLAIEVCSFASPTESKSFGSTWWLRACFGRAQEYAGSQFRIGQLPSQSWTRVLEFPVHYRMYCTLQYEIE